MPMEACEPHESMENRMLNLLKIPEFDMYRGRSEFLSEAYVIQANRIAYQDETMSEVDGRAFMQGFYNWLHKKKC